MVRVRFHTKLTQDSAYRLLVQRSVDDALSEFAREILAGHRRRNPIALARVWKALLDNGEVPSRAALARQLGVSRAHVTQVLSILLLRTEEQQEVLALGDPIEGRHPGIHALRELSLSPTADQKRRRTESRALL